MVESPTKESGASLGDDLNGEQTLTGPLRKLSTEEWMLLNRGAGEDSCESLGLQGDPTSPS